MGGPPPYYTPRLNFYAHLVAASWQTSDAEFALGAMLPDFANMASFRLAEEQPGELGKGVAFHHSSDKAFHGLRNFRGLEKWTLAHLLEIGLRRGPARGVAHVGVELCLDGALIGQADQVYLDALACAAEAPLRWSNDADAAAFGVLIGRLQEIGVPHGYRDPSVVSQRLVRIFAPRPLLALDEGEPALLQEAMPTVHGRVCDDAEEVMLALRQAL